jgi:outer membrane protein OmpA-like peptidoglycan-associated protein
LAAAPATPAAAKAAAALTALRFEEAVERAGQALFADARALLGDEPRPLVIDPLIDANTGAQTISTAGMGTQLEAIVKARHAQWSVRPLTRQALGTQPLLLIGTLTPINVPATAVDTPPDAFRVWLTLIDLRNGRVVAKRLDRATVDSVNAEPLPYFRDSPSWHKDKTVSGYINSCQVNTKIGDPADPAYLMRLPVAALVNEAVIAYGEGKTAQANKLFRDAQPLAERGDLRVLNGLYLTSWKLGQRQLARDAFDLLVESGLETRSLPVKMLFEPGKTAFIRVADFQAQYPMWVSSLGRQAERLGSCLRVVGHTSRTGNAQANETLSTQRAQTVQTLIVQSNRKLSPRLSAAGAGSKEALVGLGTDDLRDALDRRVEFRVIDCP